MSRHSSYITFQFIFAFLLIYTQMQLACGESITVDVNGLDSTCFDYFQLSLGFNLIEEACNWWHNKLSVTLLHGGKVLEMETSCLTNLDMNVYHKGKYVAKIDYLNWSWGFNVKYYDCNGNLLGNAKEEVSDVFLNNLRMKSSLSIYDSAGKLIGYSLRNNFGVKNSIDLISSQSSKDNGLVWTAVRKESSKIFCNEPSWIAMRVQQSDAIAGPISNPVHVLSLVAIEGMKNIGKTDTCTSVTIVGIVLGSILLLAVILGLVACVYVTRRQQ